MPRAATEFLSDLLKRQSLPERHRCAEDYLPQALPHAGWVSGRHPHRPALPACGGCCRRSPSNRVPNSAPQVVKEMIVRDERAPCHGKAHSGRGRQLRAGMLNLTELGALRTESAKRLRAMLHGANQYNRAPWQARMHVECIPKSVEDERLNLADDNRSQGGC